MDLVCCRSSREKIYIRTCTNLKYKAVGMNKNTQHSKWCSSHNETEEVVVFHDHDSVIQHNLLGNHQKLKSLPHVTRIKNVEAAVSGLTDLTVALSQFKLFYSDGLVLSSILIFVLFIIQIDIKSSALQQHTQFCVFYILTKCLRGKFD